VISATRENNWRTIIEDKYFYSTEVEWTGERHGPARCVLVRIVIRSERIHGGQSTCFDYC